MADESRSAALVGDREIRGTRVFDAPRELLWKVWTDPEHVVRWVYKHGGGKDVEPVNFEVTVTFKEQGGKTRLDMRMVFPSAKARTHVIETYGAFEGLKQHLGRLEEYLAKVPS